MEKPGSETLRDLVLAAMTKEFQELVAKGDYKGACRQAGIELTDQQMDALIAAQGGLKPKLVEFAAAFDTQMMSN